MAPFQNRDEQVDRIKVIVIHLKTTHSKCPQIGSERKRLGNSGPHRVPEALHDHLVSSLML